VLLLLLLFVALLLSGLLLQAVTAGIGWGRMQL
jgi:hypothetical protein